VRAPQADGVAAYVDSLLHSPSSHCRSIILCGDFNDGPVSYAHRVVGQQLADCFRESGNGPAITYHANAFYVRIDHIFCSDDWVPIECYVERKIDFSDHFPLVCRLKKRLNH
jgi:endonuclease/exonuclease/phosphatase (EEP) superfamily protein YafD